MKSEPTMIHVLNNLLPRLGRAPRAVRVAIAAIALLVATIALLLGAIAAAGVLLFSGLRRMAVRSPQGVRPAAPPATTTRGVNGFAVQRRYAGDVVDVEYRERTGGRAG